MTTTLYTGTLQSKKKAELKEIAVALHISDGGTREDLQQRIRKQLDDNQTSLEDNPTFAGLFRRRTRAPHSSQGNSAPSPASDSVEEVPEKKISSPPHSRSIRRNLLPVATPAPELQEVSMMLKNAPISPPAEDDDPPASFIATPLKERNSLFTSTPHSILRSIPRPSLELADTTFRTLQTGAKQHGRVYLLASRSTLSNSLNIALITALFELVYVLYQVIPWNFLQVPLPQGIEAGDWQLSVPYPPIATFQSPVFWSVLLHWSLPTLIIPALLGSVISFHPANSTSSRAPRVLPLDPLTASISRLAAQYGYPYGTLNATIEGIDVVGPKWRILNAAVGVAFAFAEAIFTSPNAFAESRARQRGGTPRRIVAPEE